MSNCNTWVNETRFQREYAAAIKEGTGAVDRAKAQRDKALKDAEQFNNQLKAERQNAAQAAYNAAVSAAQEKMRVRMEALAEDISNSLQAAYSKPPTSEQASYITLFKLRERIDQADVAAAFDAVKGNALALLALRDVIRGKKCTDTGLPATVPFNVFSHADAAKVAKNVTSTAAANLSKYAHSVYVYLSADANNEANKYSNWFKLCFFLEQIGA